MALQFSNPDVAKKFEVPAEFDKDFEIRVPALQWSGKFSEITPEVAEQLIKEKYNRIIPKPAKT